MCSLDLAPVIFTFRVVLVPGDMYAIGRIEVEKEKIQTFLDKLIDFETSTED